MICEQLTNITQLLDFSWTTDRLIKVPILLWEPSSEDTALSSRCQTCFQWVNLFFNLLFIYLYCIFGCVGSQLRHAGSSLRHAGSFPMVYRPLSSFQSVWVLQRVARQLQLRCASSVVVAHGAQLPHGIWDLSSLTRDRTPVPCIVSKILYH